MFIAEDIDQFKELFVGKLKAMLSDDELGAFILVLANSHQDEFLKSELDADLKKTFTALKKNFSAGNLSAAPDDVDVFERLLEVDLDEIPVWQYNDIGDWDIAFNPIRQLRPERVSSQVLTSIKQPFDDSRFHFNKPFLKPEILWEGEFKGISSRVLYNKFPFSEYHLLIVLSPENNSSQLLTQDSHRYVFSLVEQMREVFPGFGIGYNSLAAGASVNHFHFQGFVREADFSIEKDQWDHNGGDQGYPLEVQSFTDAATSWDYLNQLTTRDIAFNCLYRDGCCYVVPRKYQGSVELPEWLQGAGWIDVAGAITVSDNTVFNKLQAGEIFSGLDLLKQ